MKDVLITSAKRTAVGSLGKSLKNINAAELGSAVITSAIDELKIKNSDVDEVIMGQVLTGGTGQNPARQASINSGIPKEKPAYVVNQVCGSGIRSIASGYQSIKSGDSKIIVAGGQENMSLAPHAIHLREGKKLGNTELIDTMIKDGFGTHLVISMGVTLKMLQKNFKLLEKRKINFHLSHKKKHYRHKKKISLKMKLLI